MKKINQSENSFEKSIERFDESIEALREFVQLIEAFLSDRKQKFMQEHQRELAPMLLVFRKLSPEDVPADGPSEEDIRKKIDGDVIISTTDEADGKKRTEIKITGNAQKSFFETMEQLTKTDRPIKLLYRSTLMNLISSVELFLSDLIRLYYVKFPDAIGAKDKIFSLEDLKEFNSIEEARLFIIESKIEGIMHGAFSDWIDFFKNQPKLSMSYLKDPMVQLTETCQRRNLIVHNGGIVNAIYLSKIDKGLSKELKNGDELIVSSDYLKSRLELFELNCSLIALELWKKFAPEDKQRGELLLGKIFSHLVASRWRVAEGLAQFLMNDKCMSEEQILVAKLNYWLALKRQKKWAEIKNEVEAEDMSAAKIRYRLGWFALCEKWTLFLKNCQSLFAQRN
jgi:hypothetical protein